MGILGTRIFGSKIWVGVLKTSKKRKKNDKKLTKSGKNEQKQKKLKKKLQKDVLYKHLSSGAFRHVNNRRRKTGNEGQGKFIKKFKIFLDIFTNVE